MDNKLSWFDKNITPLTKSYRNFIKELKNTPTEQFFMDGERNFTKKEKKFLDIYDFKSGMSSVKINNIKEVNINAEKEEDDKILLKPSEQLKVDNIISKLKEYQAEGLKYVSLSHDEYITNTYTDDEKLRVISNDNLYLSANENDFKLLNTESKYELTNTENNLESLVSGNLYKSTDISELIKSFENQDIFIPTEITNAYSLDVDELDDFAFKLDGAHIMNEDYKKYLNSPEVDNIISKLKEYQAEGLKYVSLSNKNYQINTDTKEKKLGITIHYNPVILFSRDKRDFVQLNNDDFIRNEKDPKIKVGATYIPKDISELIKSFENKKIFKEQYNMYDYSVNNPKAFLEKIERKATLENYNTKIEKDLKDLFYSKTNYEIVSKYLDYLKDNNVEKENIYQNFKEDLINKNFPKEKIENLETFIVHNLYSSEDEKNQLSVNDFVSMVKTANKKIDNELRTLLVDDNNYNLIDKYINYQDEEHLNFHADLSSNKYQNIYQNFKEDLINKNFPKEKIENLETFVQEKISQSSDVGMKTFSQRIREVKSTLNNEIAELKEKNVDKLVNQLKLYGFGDEVKLKKDLENGINPIESNFSIQTFSNKTQPENTINFTLNFNKSENGEIKFNSYLAELKTKNNEIYSHEFTANNHTAKEAINLLEGRSVRGKSVNKETGEIEDVFIKFKLTEEKEKNGNYKQEVYDKSFNISTSKIVESNKLIFDKPEYKDATIKSLEKGNIVKVKYKKDDTITEGKAILNVQYKKLNLYDMNMNRINTNEPLKNIETKQKQEKSNARQQHISREIKSK